MARWCRFATFFIGNINSLAICKMSWTLGHRRSLKKMQSAKYEGRENRLFLVGLCEIVGKNIAGTARN